MSDVHALIEDVKPDSVCVELCQTRYDALTDKSRWQNLDIFKVIKEGKTLLLLANLAISSYQRRLGKQLGVEPGAELLAAANKAKEIGAELSLIDRDVHITLKRTWASLSFTKKCGLVGLILQSLFSKQEVSEADIERMKDKVELSQMLAEFAEVMPEVKRPLIDERDAYLMAGVEQAKGSNIVAVVGAAHVSGMKQQLGQPVDRDLLEQIPERSTWIGLLKWIIPIIVVLAFFFGYHRHEGRTLEQMFLAWILPNSILSALLTAIAGGKVVSVLTAMFASPITSLNPLLGAGMVVGLVEAWLRKPTVEDAQRINEDVQTLRGFYRNKFTRVLMVAVMSTLGSAIGAWIGLSWILTLVA